MGLFDPQGISSSPSTQSITTSGINAWAQPYVMNYLNRGNALLNQGPTDFQKQVWGNAQNLQAPGQFGEATSLAQQGGQGALSTAPMALGYGQAGANYGQMGAGIGAQGIGIGAQGQQYGMNAGSNYAQQATNPYAVGAYMNPFIQQALAPQMQLLNQQQELAAQNINAKAAGQGAFGGNRATLAQGLNAQNYDLARQQAMGQAYTNAYQQAQQAQQFGAQLGLQGAMQGTQLGLQGLGTALQGAGIGIQGAQAGLQGVQGAQQGYQGATQAGAALGNIGAQQSQADVARLALQNQIANQQYNLPYQQLNFMQGLMSGLPVTTSTTQGYQAGQNPWLQGIGAAGTLASYAPNVWNTGKDIWNWATGGSGGSYIPNTLPYMDNRDIGLIEGGASPSFEYIAKGGQIKGGGVKRYAEGGIASINRKVLNDPTSYSDQTINQSAQNNVLGGVTKLLALDTIAKQRAALQAQQAMQAQPRPPIAQQLAQQAAMGIDSAESNLPQQYAGGGIIAFDEGGNVPRFYGGGINWFGRADKGTEESTPSAFQEDIRKFNENTKEKIQIPDWLRDIGNYFTKPRQAPTDADAQPGGFYGNGSNVAPTAPATPDSGIVIHPSTSKSSGIGGGAPAAAPAPTYKPADTSGIDVLTKRYEDMIRGGEDFKESEKKAETTAMRNLFLNMMNPERGASFVSGLGAAGKEAQAGLEKSLEGIQARKDKQIGQLVALGLKGQDLKNEAKKLGISESELQAKLPLYQSEVAKNFATADYMRSGKGRAAGKIASATAYKIMQDYKGYAASPSSAPFFNTLSPEMKKALSLPGTESYNRAMVEFNKILQREMANEIGTLQAIGGGSSSNLVD